MTQETNNQNIASVDCYIGMGSNLDNPIQHINTAILELQQLASVSNFEVSSLYRSAPVGPAGQDDYINAVAKITTTLSPEALLDQLQTIENSHQRVRIERWGARTLDLDILLYSDLTINTPRLTIPHFSMCDRNFVLVPLAQLSNTLIINGTAINALIEQCPAGSLEKL